MEKYKIAILGVGGVGKSSLLVQFTQNHFIIGEYDPTIEDSYQKFVEIDEKTCTLDIHDPPGQEEYSAMRERYMRTCRGFILIYSTTSRPSFEEINIIREHTLRIQERDEIPMIIVGNKCDIKCERKVTMEEGEKLAKSFRYPFFETSAKDKINVENSFYQLVREIRKFDQPIDVLNDQKGKKKGICSLQ